jgi:RNA polymerase sigma-70 factor (ECF subfamily)
MGRTSESSVLLPFRKGVRGERTAGLSPLEEEVVALFGQFRNPLLRYVMSFGVPAADGEEIVQEIFLALFQHLQRGKSKANLRGWVFRVGHNMAIKQRFRNQRQVLSPSGEDMAGEALDPEPNPEEQIATAQRRNRLLELVQDLPERDRCCLNLRAEGLRYREIAEVLGMSLGGVALSLGRSLRRLVEVEGSHVE